MARGPLQVSMHMYEDFRVYKKGEYNTFIFIIWILIVFIMQV